MAIHTNARELMKRKFTDLIAGRYNEEKKEERPLLRLLRSTERYVQGSDLDYLFSTLPEGKCRVALGTKSGRMYILHPESGEYVLATSTIQDIYPGASADSWSVVTTSGHEYRFVTV